MTTRVARAPGAGPEIRFFIPFAKAEEQADGSVYVEGIATSEVLDFHGEIVSYEASKRAFEEWSAWAEKATDGKSLGNIRIMHKPEVAGRAVKWWSDDATRSIHLGATIEDPTAAKLCKTGAYTGYSIGGGNVAREMQNRDGAMVPVVVDYRLSENSIVDKPACPTSIFTLVKRYDEKESSMQKPIDFLKANLSAALLFAAAMPERDAVKIGDDLIVIGGTPDAPELGVRKDASSAIAAGNDAIEALKKFMLEVLSIPGDPDLWTIGDLCESMRYCFSARMGAQYASAETVAAAIGAELKKSEGTGDDLPEDDTTTEELPPKPADPEPAPAPAEEVPPSLDAGAIENAVKAALAPFLEALSDLRKTFVPATLEAVDAPQAVTKADLSGFAKAEDVTKVLELVKGLTSLVEKIPAPLPGTPVIKTLGSDSVGSGEGELSISTMEKTVELLEKSLSGPERASIRKALAAATISAEAKKS